MKWHFASNMRVRSKRAARVPEIVERLVGRSFAWVEFPELRALFGSRRLCGVARIEAGGFAAFRKLFGSQASRGRWRALEVR